MIIIASGKPERIASSYMLGLVYGF